MANLYNNTTSLRQALELIKNKAAGGGGGGEKLTLFTPSIDISSASNELTITDENGSFATAYDLYVNGEFFTTLSSKTATLTDYIEHTETMEIKVQATATNFNSSEFSNVIEWKVIVGTVGLAYTLSSDGTYAICSGIGETTETDIEIASLYDSVPVTTIGEEAFKQTNITTLVIPDSVTTIGQAAFSTCKSLVSAVIGENVTSIPNTMFYKSDKLESVNIPNSVISIGSSAFNECRALKSITIPNSVTSIDTRAFQYCSSLKRVDLSTHTTIPTLGNSNAFMSTDGYALQIKVPASLIDEWKSATNWSTHADKIVTRFSDEPSIGLTYEIRTSGGNNYAICTGIGDAVDTDILIASEYEGTPVKSIASKAFQNCTSLTSVTIPESVTSIDTYAFMKCTSLTSVTIPESVTSIGAMAFNSCTSLTSIEIPDGVTSIGPSAFNGCSKLTSTTIPNSVTMIDNSVFSSCTSLTSITIPNSVKTIEGSAFSGCRGLTSVSIPNSVTKIGESVFSSCSNLKRVDFSNHTSVPTLSNASAFRYTHSDLQIKVPESLYNEWIAKTNWSDYADKIVTEFTNEL